MRLICSSDWHADAVTQGVDRYPEIRKSVKHSVEYAISVKADAYLFGGDLADPHNVKSHRASQLAIEMAIFLQENGINSYWIAGNHDVIEDGTNYTTLSSLFACSIHPENEDEAEMEVSEEPWVYHSRAGFNLITLPFTPTSRRYDPAKHVIDSVNELYGDEPTIILGHLNLHGITPGSETNEMAKGRDVFWPMEAIREHLPKAICIGGHYHEQQVFDGVHIIGSISRLTFGEGANDVGFLEVRV